MSAPKRHDYFAPDSFGRAVQDHIGDAVLMRLRQALGGSQVRIPVRDSVLMDDHYLVKAIGREDALRMTAIFGGELVYVPTLCKDSKYLTALANGLSNLEIAQELGVSQRQVRRIFARNGVQNPNQQRHTVHALRPAQAERRHMIAAE